VTVTNRWERAWGSRAGSADSTIHSAISGEGGGGSFRASRHLKPNRTLFLTHIMVNARKVPGVRLAYGKCCSVRQSILGKAKSNMFV
jgi:hypothetical protein